MITTLSPRQLRIAELLKDGKKIQEISEIMGIVRHTVHGHLCLAYKKTGTRNVAELTQKITAEGLADLKPHQIPHNPSDRYKFMTRLRWRDGDDCCVCGELIDFRIKKKLDPKKASFYYESRGSIESAIKLAHSGCNPLCGVAGEKVETEYATE